jgi:5-methylcytosine-specific restriction endonuclease McrA
MKDLIASGRPEDCDGDCCADCDPVGCPYPTGNTTDAEIDEMAHTHVTALADEIIARNVGCAREAARNLKRHYWIRTPESFLVTCLMAAGEDYSLRCEYCGAVVFSKEVNSIRNMAYDHLLPRSLPKEDLRYTNVMDDLTNCVLCCHRCNFVKGKFNPNKDGRYTPGTGPLTSIVREELISRSKEEIRRRLEELHPRSWSDFCKAVDMYRLKAGRE